MLEAVDQRDDEALDKAIKRLDISTLYLPEYKSLLLPLNLAILGKQMDLTHYRIQSYDAEKELDNADKSILKELDSDSWSKIQSAAVNIQARLLLSTDPVTLECESELCNSL